MFILARLATINYRESVCTSVGLKFSGLTYRSRAKWKTLRGIYSAIYGEVNVSVSVCVEIKEAVLKNSKVVLFLSP